MRICMLLEREDVRSDGRVRREIRALTAAGHQVVLLHRGAAAPGGDAVLDGARLHSVEPRGRVLAALPGPVLRAARLIRYAVAAARLRPDAVHAHDLTMLGPGWLAARLAGAALVFDTHEYATGVPYHSRAARLAVRALQRVLLPRCSAIIAVSEGTAAALAADYALPAPPAVVRNVPELDWGADRRGEVADLRADLGLAPGDPLVVHQGAANANRGGAELVEAVGRLPGVHLLFLGDIAPAYAGALRAAAARHGAPDRVHLRPGVPLEVLLDHTRQADAGVCLSDPRWINHRLTLSNKLFEYIAAGLPVVATAGTAFGDLVERLGVGFTARFGDPEHLAAAVGAALAGAGDEALRARLDAAGSRLHWGVERERVLAVYAALGR